MQLQRIAPVGKHPMAEESVHWTSAKRRQIDGKDGGQCQYRVRTARGKPGKPGKRDFLKKNQGKPGKLREFSDHFYNLRENSGNFILPNISDQIGGALRINEASK